MSILMAVNRLFFSLPMAYLRDESWDLFFSFCTPLHSVPSFPSLLQIIIYTQMIPNFTCLSQQLNSVKIFLILKKLFHWFKNGCRLIFFHSILLKLNFWLLVCGSSLLNSIILLYLCLILSHFVQWSLPVIWVSFLILPYLTLNISLPFLNLVSIIFGIWDVFEAQ